MDHKLTPQTIQAINEFLGKADIVGLRKNLRDLFLFYLAEEYEELPPHYGRFIEDMMFLLRLLDGVNGIDPETSSG